MSEDIIIEEKNKRVVNSKALRTKINQGRVIFDNYKLNDVLLAKLTSLGYTDEVMAVGIGLLDALEACIDTRKTTKAKKLESSVELNDALAIANSKYIKYLDLARVIFKGNTEMDDLLDLSGSRKGRFAYKVKQMKSFYTNVLREDVLAEFVKHGKTAEEITAEKAFLDNVLDLDSVQENNKGELKLKVNDKQEAERNYLEWINKLIRFLKIEFRDNPDILEKLMI